MKSKKIGQNAVMKPCVSQSVKHFRGSRSQMFCKIGAFKNLAKSMAKQIC